MRLEEYLELVLPPTGNYFYEWNTWPANNHISKPAPDLATLALMVRNKNHAGFDTWVAVGSFGPSRQAKDCLEKKAFYIDLDVGPKKPYPSLSDAVAALGDACTGSFIPKPTFILQSGNGLHAYWVLKESIPAQEWKPLAVRLKAACRRGHLHADDVVTADTARIMRPPETLNYKDRANPKQVGVGNNSWWKDRMYTKDTLSLMLPMSEEQDEEAPVRETSNSRTGAALAAAVSIDDLKSGVDLGPFGASSEVEKIRLAQEMLSCIRGSDAYTYKNWMTVGAALYDAAASGDCDFPTWKDLWDSWSQKSDKYDPVELAEKWDAEFPGFHSISVASLIFLAKGFGFCFPNAVRNIAYPPGYIATDFGTIREPGADEENAAFVMSSHLSDVDVRVDLQRGHVYTAKAYSPSSKRTLHLDTCDVSFSSGSMKLGEEFGRAGIVIKGTKQALEVMNFMQSFMDQIANARGVSDVVSSFGWVERGGRIGFAAGKDIYWDDTTCSPSVSVHSETKDLYTPTGSLARWQKVVQSILDQDRQAINTIIASAFAAPLIPFTSVSGMVVSLISRDSGTGKSTALRAAQSVWGRPQGGINALDDTVNAVTKKLELLQNLPAYWDEVRMQHQTKEFVKLIFQLSQGKGKTRMNSAAQLQHTGTWSTLIAVAGNEPLSAHMENMVGNTNAGALRLLELFAEGVPAGPSGVASSMREFSRMETNFGVAGAAYAKWLAENKSKAEAWTQQTMASMDSALETTADERFWLATVSAIYTGAYIANHIGVLDFDLRSLRRFLVEEFWKHRVKANMRSGKLAALSALEEFTREFKPNSINTDIVALGSGRPKQVAILWPHSLTSIRHPLAYQRGQDDVLILHRETFKQWLYNKGITMDAIEQDLLTLGAIRVRATMGAGTSETLRGDVLKVDTAQAPFNSLFAPV